MKVQKIVCNHHHESNWEMVKNDGTKIHPATEKKVRSLMRTVQRARVLGNGTGVTELVALRIAAALVNNWNVSKK